MKAPAQYNLRLQPDQSIYLRKKLELLFWLARQQGLLPGTFPLPQLPMARTPDYYQPVQQTEQSVESIYNHDQSVSRLTRPDGFPPVSGTSLKSDWRVLFSSQ